MLGLRLLSGPGRRPLQLVEVTLTLVLLQYRARGLLQQPAEPLQIGGLALDRALLGARPQIASLQRPQVMLGRRLALGGRLLARTRPFLVTPLALLLLRPAPGRLLSRPVLIFGLAHDARPGRPLNRHDPDAVQDLLGGPAGRLLQ